MLGEDDPSRGLEAAPFPEENLAGYMPSGRQPPQRAVPVPRHAEAGAVESALSRLEETLDAETAGLRAGQPIDFEEVNRRKNRSLLELTRLSRNLPADRNDELRTTVERIRDKLSQNRRTVDLHVSAVREIAEMMSAALSEAESDGTYAMAPKR